MTVYYLLSYPDQIEMQNVEEYTRFYELCYFYQVATILPESPVPEGACAVDAFEVVLLPLAPYNGPIYFESPWRDAFAVHCLIWCLLAQPAHELSLCLLNACLLCPYLLLTLCIWNYSLTAAFISENSVSPSSARVGATSNVWHSFKLLTVHFADQAQAVVKLLFALP